MSDLAAAARREREAEQKCRDIPHSLPMFLYRRRLNAAMREWWAANVALFDAQVSAERGAGDDSREG